MPRELISVQGSLYLRTDWGRGVNNLGFAAYFRARLTQFRRDKNVVWIDLGSPRACPDL